MPTKRCPSCEQSLPLTDFYRAKDRSDGLQVYCKVCLRRKIKEEHQRREDSGDVSLDTFYDRQHDVFRLCRQCKKVLPETQFYVSRSRRSRSRAGLASRCMECCREHARNRQKGKTQAEKEGMKRRRRERLDAGLCGTCNTLRIQHSSSHCLRHWFVQTSSNHFGTSKHAKRLQEIAERQGYLCPYTGKKLVPCVNMTLDHIVPVSRDPENANSIDNVQWVDDLANRSKNTMTHDEFLIFCHEVASRFVHPMVANHPTAAVI